MFSRLIRSRLRFEPLEDRRVPATYVVTTTAAQGTGSLRQAILDANGNPGLDRIEFNVNGGGVQVIDGVAPDVTDPVDLDGRTQPGYAGTPLIVVRTLGGASALTLVDHRGSSVRGFVFQDPEYNLIDDRYMIRLVRGGRPHDPGELHRHGRDGNDFRIPLDQGHSRRPL